jgi:hypothetical protein
MRGVLGHCSNRLVRAVVAGAMILSIPAASASPIDLPPAQFAWHPEMAREGPVVVVVSLDEQRAYVYRNGIRIGVSSVSSGRSGYPTPTGVFAILQKEREHYSNRYDNAPMPFMERLTWDGVAVHGGHVPGYPASHGCIRLPVAFAERLFEITRRGQIVVVAQSGSAPVTTVHPALLAPVTPTGAVADLPPPGERSLLDGAPEEGPVTVLIGIRDKVVLVLRNGIAVGSALLTVDDEFAWTGTVLLVVEPGLDAAPSHLDSRRPRHKWTMYPIDSEGPAPTVDALSGKLHVRDDVARALYDLLTPGTSIIVTTSPLLGSSSIGTSRETVLDTDPAGVMLSH